MTDQLPPALEEALIARVEVNETLAALAWELEDAFMRQYRTLPWEDAKDVAEGVSFEALAEVAYSALARHHADEIAAYRSQLDATQRALASVVAERDGLREALARIAYQDSVAIWISNPPGPPVQTREYRLCGEIARRALAPPTPDGERRRR